MECDITKLKTSWTKYDIVQTLNLLSDKENLLSYIEAAQAGSAKINTPILKAFLGVETLSIETLPSYWLEILKYPIERKLFGLFSLILSHYEVMEIFKRSSSSNMTGNFVFDNNTKMYTNIRSCLVESEAAESFFRRKKEVPFNFSKILINKKIGILFKELLIDRLNLISQNIEVNEKNYYRLVEEFELYKCFCCESIFFKNWLESDTFSNNESTNFSHIKEVKVNKFYSIEETIALDFEDSKEIYFVGENGDGKSLMLMAIYLAFNKEYILKHTDQKKTGKIKEIIKDNPNLSLSGKGINGESDYLINFFAYGAHHDRFSSDNYEQYGFMTLFDSNETLINPEQWIKNQALLNTYNTGVSIDFIKQMLSELLDKAINIELKGTELFFEEKNHKELKFDQLSEGVKSIIILVIDLLFRLQTISGDNNDISKISAIVIIDEIDLHLYPKWKQTIVPKLRSIFKNIQFIFTTYSPMVIQGASDDAIIFRIFRDEAGIIRIANKYYRKESSHKMLDTLEISSLFSLDSAQ